MNDFRPFQLLKLIRDGVVTTMMDMRAANSHTSMNINRFIKGLAKIGLIEYDPKTRSFKPTTGIAELQDALGVSFTELAAYGRASIIANPVFGAPTTPPKPSDVFVVMPFTSELHPLYGDHMRAVADRLQVSIARADDFFSASSVVIDVWNAIANARVLIADCTGRNPNVFYELGVAHTLGKPVILISQRLEDIPFDVRHIRVIQYDFTPRGMHAFESVLEATLKTEIERKLDPMDAVWPWMTRVG